MLKTALLALFYTSDSDVINSSYGKIVGSGGVESVRNGNGKVKNLSKVKSIKKLAKLKKSEKTISDKASETGFFTSKARVAFT